MEIRIEQIKFTEPVIKKLRNLSNNGRSGMRDWFRYLTNKRLSWIGYPPENIFAAYHEDRIIGWCGIGTSKGNQVGVLNTFVNPLYRRNGIGKRLIEAALQAHTGPNQICADMVSFDVAHLVKKHSLECKSIFSLYEGKVL